MDVADEYQERLQVLIKDLRYRHDVSYKELARRLERLGFVIDDRVLANRINRGGFHAGLAILVLQALGFTNLHFTTKSKKLNASK